MPTHCARVALLLLAFSCGASASCSSSGDSSPDDDGDADGVKGGNYNLVVMASDTAFSPSILKAENDASIMLTFENVGTKPHGFVVDGMSGSSIASVDPGGHVTITFETPDREGIYVVHSALAGDTLPAGQFIVQ